ncbi:MAG TPA: hypothetical protein VG345_08355 [Bryobacteraceae bacterium]|nr:hypothetical protein [Bryobacteraceae bacterium]
MSSTGQQAMGDDITGASDAIVMASAPDVALPLETEASNTEASNNVSPVALPPRDSQFRRPWPAIVASAAMGLLLGIVLKKSI